MRFSATATGDRLLPTQLAERARPWLSKVDSLFSARDARGEAGRNALIAFAIRIINAVIAFFSQVFLARWMGGFEYGIYVLVWVTMIISAIFPASAFTRQSSASSPNTGQKAPLRNCAA